MVADLITKIERRVGQGETVTVCWYGWVKFSLVLGLAVGLGVGLLIGYVIGVGVG